MALLKGIRLISERWARLVRLALAQAVSGALPGAVPSVVLPSVLILTGALGLVSVASADTPPSVEATTSVRSIAVGDTFRLDLIIRWDKGTQVKPLAVPDKIGDFVVKDISEGAVRPGDEPASKSISLLLTTFETGPRTIPPISIVYVGEDGATAAVETPLLDVEVKSILPEDATDLRDIKRPLEVPKRWKDIVLSYLLIVGLALAAGASVLVSFKRREEIEAFLRKVWQRIYGPLAWLVTALLVILRLRRREQIAVFDIRVDEPGLVPSQAALKELDRIEALGLVERGMINEFYTLVSETLRRYLERQFGLLAMESPTSFTLEALEAAGLTDPGLRLIREVLTEADLVKFAKHAPAKETIAAVLERSREIVGATAQCEPVGADPGLDLGGPQR